MLPPNSLSMPPRLCPVSEQSVREEIFNVATHFLGFVLSCIGLLSLWEVSTQHGTLVHRLTAALYGGSWVFLYAASSLYHASRDLERKRRLRVIDHCAIFLVIAASYGPYVVHLAAGWRGYSVWAAVWAIAIFGCLFKTYSKHRYGVMGMVAYIVQGWLVVLLLPVLLPQLAWAGTFWLVAGGVSVTGGLLVYVMDHVDYNHGLWHLSVVLCSICIYFSIAYSVMPRPF